MRRHLNTLYVTTQDAYVSKDGLNIVTKANGSEIARVPAHMIGGIVCFGRVLMSPAAIGFCSEQGIVISHLTESGRFLARVEGPVTGNVLLRRQQYRCSDYETGCVAIIRGVLIGKTLNQRAVIRRALRDHGDNMGDDSQERLRSAEGKLTHIVRKAERPAAINELRGVEGEAANVYFSIFQDLLRIEDAEFRFNGRSRRPPLDPVNALLSFVYTLLVHDIRSALETVGLDPAVGFLHRDRPGRPSLALDLLEEFRPFFADRLVLSLINRGQVTGADFRRLENGAVLMNDEVRKTVLVAYQERKRDEITHPFLEERVTVGLLWYVQAQLLARHIRGDLDGYPPFVWK
jgi:CRISPR-associated protein Cas1